MDESLWIASEKSLKKSFFPLKEDLSCDVCIVGGGITGLSCAYALTKAGLTVMVLEKDKFGYQASGNTTAKITSQHGLFYRSLEERFGLPYANDYLHAHEEAINGIASIVEEEKIDCDFEWQDSYVFTQEKKQIDFLKQEMETLEKLNFPARYITDLSVPFDFLAGIKFPKQACFHPIKYMKGLIDCILNRHGLLFEDSQVYDVKKEDTFHAVYTKDHKVYAKHVILATKYPFLNAPGFYFMKLYQEMSYLIAIGTKSPLFPEMYITAEKPTLSFRSASYEGKKVLLIGGNEHKTGEKINLEDRYTLLEETAKSMYPDAKVLYRWHTEDAISVDELPYIGEFSTMTPQLYVATGFKKWGMTTSYLAAQILTNQILKKENPYSDLFISTRFHPLENKKEVGNMLKETTYSLVINKTVLSPDQIQDIPKEDARLIEWENHKIGVYKDKQGKLYGIKPACTHLGCELSFNNLAKTWDCPCHGSRFDYRGHCLYGPALKDLEIVDLSPLSDSNSALS